MAFKQDLRTVWMALSERSAVAVGVTPAVRRLLTQRQLELSRRSGVLSQGGVALVLFGLANGAPWGPRLALMALFSTMFATRVWLARRSLASLAAPIAPVAPEAPRTAEAAAAPLLRNDAYNLLLLGDAIGWGALPWLLDGWLSPVALSSLLFLSITGVALQALICIAALPAAVVLVLTRALPMVAFMASQPSIAMAVMAVATLASVAAMLLLTGRAHADLLRSLQAEQQNAEMVRELQSYRFALENENASLGTSLRDASLAANVDPLTGLFNRRYIIDFAQNLAESVRRGREEVTLCMIDVDHFKRVNDRYGHPVGDEVLGSVAALLAARLRDGDCLARVGGEEFMAVLRGCNVSRARRVAESLRHNVAGSIIATEAGEVPVTVSIGVAQWDDREEFSALVERADRALYEAKHSGRDRVEIDHEDSGRLSTIAGDFATTGPLH